MAIISFYSFKGGVGRTFTALEVAAQLARRGRSVCLWDLDLEAPALHRHPQVRDGLEAAPLGTLELFEGAADDGAVAGEQVARAISTKQLSDGRPISFLLAASLDRLDGEQDPETSGFMEGYLGLEWEEQFASGRGLNLFVSVADELADRFDVVIVDARTGLTDLGLLSTRVLADAVVLVFGLSDQNLEGVRRATAALTLAVGSEPSPPVFRVANLVPDELERASNPRVAGAYQAQLNKLVAARLQPDVELPLVTPRLIDDRVPSLDGVGNEGAAQEAVPFRPIVEWIEDQLVEAAPSISRRGEQFEEEVRSLLAIEGWRPLDVTDDAGTRLEGVDLFLHRASVGVHEALLVECKDATGEISANRVPRPADVERRIGAARERMQAAIGATSSVRYLLVSRGGYSRGAIDAALAGGVDAATVPMLVAGVLGLWRAPDHFEVHASFGPVAARTVTDHSSGAVTPLHDQLVRWLEGRGQPRQALLGGPGSGKSVALLQFARSQASHWRTGRSRGALPLLVRARSHGRGGEGLPRLVIEENGLRATPEVLVALVQQRHVAVLVDGFDEVADPVGLASGIEHLATVGGRVLVSTRPPLAPGLRRALGEDDLGVATLDPLDARTQIQLLEALELDSDQIARVRSSTVLQSLLTAPAGASIIGQLLAEVGALPRSDVDLLVEAARVLVGGGDARSRGPNRLDAAIAIAEWSWLHDAVDLPWSAVTRQVLSLDEQDFSVLNTPLFVRVADESYRFAARALHEALLARRLRRALIDADRRWLDVKAVPAGVIDLAVQLLDETEAAIAGRWLPVIVGDPEAGLVVTANAVRILRAMHQVLPADLQLSGVDLRSADLSGMRLVGANLERANLAFSDLRRTTFAGADLRRADLTGADLRDAVLLDADLRGALLNDADLRGAAVDPATLAKARRPGAWLDPGLEALLERSTG
jgi:cellulose biosynthesis protein BcsQ